MVFCCRYIAELALTSKCSAASRRDPPASTNSITRILKSPGYGPRIGQTPPNQCARLAPPANFGNPDSLRLERAVATALFRNFSRQDGLPGHFRLSRMANVRLQTRPCAITRNNRKQILWPRLEHHVEGTLGGSPNVTEAALLQHLGRLRLPGLRAGAQRCRARRAHDCRSALKVFFTA